MKAMMKVLALLAVVAMASVAFAKEGGDKAAKAAAPEALRGIVVSASNNSITLKSKGGKETTVATNDQTKITVDGKSGTLADVKAGMHVKILPADGSVATSVSANTPKDD